MNNERKTDTEKKKQRKEVLAIRDHMPEQEWLEKSRRIVTGLMEHPAFHAAEHVLCYVNYKKEVETGTLIEKSLSLGKHVYCPCVFGKEMDFYEIFSLEELEAGFRGILEPAEAVRQSDRLFRIPEKEPVLMVMPGAVFDRAHHRIGYGGGYYDRYLSKIDLSDQGVIKTEKAGGLVTAALAFSFQIKDHIPYEEHDICPQMIVTEGEIIG